MGSETEAATIFVKGEEEARGLAKEGISRRVSREEVKFGVREEDRPAVAEAARSKRGEEVNMVLTKERPEVTSGGWGW